MRGKPPFLRFWGVRGSVPTPGPATARTGGNTACLELQGGGSRVVFDAGTGLRPLGVSLLAEKPSEIHIVLGHYHWDHMLGLPFFPPIYGGGWHIHVYGERKKGGGPREALRRQFMSPHFPVDFRLVEKHLEFHEVKEGDKFKIGAISLQVGRLNHPQGAISYRATVGGRVLVYASDHEHDGKGDAGLVNFSKGAHALVYDAMFTGATYEASKRGWGHSTWEEACRVAKATGVEKLYLFHHDPAHDDKRMAQIERSARRAFPGAAVAREGAVIAL